MFDTPLCVRLQQYYAPDISRIITAYLSCFVVFGTYRFYQVLHGRRFNNLEYGIWRGKSARFTYFHGVLHGKQKRFFVKPTKPNRIISFYKNNILLQYLMFP